MLNSFILDISRSGIMNFFRTLLATIDWVVYSIITIFFRTVFNLSNFELTGFYQEFEERVYVILGIFMLFKVTVSILSYLVNPDKISDKEQGVGKIVTRIISVLIMLIALPSVFSLMTEFQNKLLPVIPRIVVGTANTLNSDDITGISDNMALTLFQGFAHKKDECDGDEIGNVSEILNVINEPCSDSNKNIYRYDYLPIISTIVGVLMCYVLFSLCISVAIRAFKMIILRAIAPIPIISYVDPKSSKDGMFATWTKTLFSTWSELFILIAIIYFIVYMIDFLLSGQAWRGFFDGVTNPVESVFLLAFIIIGLLFFARQVPKFLFDALGIKNRGSFMRMLGMGATALGMGGSVASQFRNRNQENPDHKIRNFGASLFGGIASGEAGANALLSADKPTWHTGTDQIQKSQAVALSRISGNSTLGGRLLSGVQSTLGIQTKYEKLDSKVKDYEAATSAWKRIDNALNSDTQVGIAASGSVIVGNETIFAAGRSYTAKEANDIVERMKTSGRYTQQEIDEADSIKKAIQKERFNQIRTTAPANVNSLTGTAAQIYAGTKTIYDIGKQYSGDDDKVFADFAGAKSIDDSNLDNMPKTFKGTAYDAGRQAEVIKASPEYISANADAKRRNGS